MSSVGSDWQPSLKGRLLSLRPVTRHDWRELFSIGCDPKVWAGHPNHDRHLESRFRAYFEEGLACGCAVVAVEAATNRIIGWSRYSSAFVGAGEIEIGWTFLGRDWWGGSCNAEMKTLMLAHAFKFVDRALFRIACSNLRSRRAAEKIGATLLVDRPAPIEPGGVPHLFYAVERSAFATGRTPKN